MWPQESTKSRKEAHENHEKSSKLLEEIRRNREE
jgi:hypothetical protein